MDQGRDTTQRSPPGENKKPRRGARRVAIRPLRMFVRLASRKEYKRGQPQTLVDITFFGIGIAARLASRGSNLVQQALPGHMAADCCNGCIDAPGDLRVTETGTSFRRFLPVPVLDFGLGNTRHENQVSPSKTWGKQRWSSTASIMFRTCAPLGLNDQAPEPQAESGANDQRTGDPAVGLAERGAEQRAIAQRFIYGRPLAAKIRGGVGVMTLGCRSLSAKYCSSVGVTSRGLRSIPSVSRIRRRCPAAVAYLLKSQVLPSHN